MILQLRIIISRILNKLFIATCNKLPVRKDKVVFSNFNGNCFGDNPKYIALEILHQNLPYDLVWLVKSLDEVIPSGIRKVRINSKRAYYEISTAKIIIRNIKNEIVWKKKSCQYYIQTWHGSFPLKYIEQEAEQKLSTHYIEKSKADSAITNLFLVSCLSDKKIVETSFWYSGEIFMKGVPRNDVLFSKNQQSAILVRNTLHIPCGYKIALFAPTFRDNSRTDVYNLDFQALKQTLEIKTGFEWVIIIRLHPNVKHLSIDYQYTDQIIDGSNYSDPQDLVIASDLLITDYSSMLYDFSLMKKPVFLYAYDLEEYEKERGLRPIYFELPFSLCRSDEELRDAIMNYDNENYQTRLKNFMDERVQSFDNGHASEAVVDRIKNVIEGRFKMQ